MEKQQFVVKRLVDRRVEDGLASFLAKQAIFSADDSTPEAQGSLPPESVQAQEQAVVCRDKEKMELSKEFQAIGVVGENSWNAGAQETKRPKSALLSNGGVETHSQPSSDGIEIFCCSW
jgi:hypothetical protein